MGRRLFLLPSRSGTQLVRALLASLANFFPFFSYLGRCFFSLILSRFSPAPLAFLAPPTQGTKFTHKKYAPISFTAVASNTRPQRVFLRFKPAFWCTTINRYHGFSRVGLEKILSPFLERSIEYVSV